MVRLPTGSRRYSRLETCTTNFGCSTSALCQKRESSASTLLHSTPPLSILAFMNEPFRTESDSMGPMQVPASAYYGAQTARAVENFPISNLRFPRRFVRAMGLIKKNAALTNQDLGGLKADLADAIVKAAQEVIDGKWDGEFVLDIFQTGSGTSTNMNANEVIANRASELMGGQRGGKLVHPNDHVNRGQSSNDAIPTAIHLAALEGLERSLLPALEELSRELETKANA